MLPLFHICVFFIVPFFYRTIQLRIPGIRHANVHSGMHSPLRLSRFTIIADEANYIEERDNAFRLSITDYFQFNVTISTSAQ